LTRYLQSIGIPDEASPDLKSELESIRAAGRSKGRELIARLVGKAATSGTGVAIEVAAAGIAKTIAGYLGFHIG
jgi:hypothetical protein